MAPPNTGSESAAQHPASEPTERLVFLQAYLKNWRIVGSITPSSQHLARRMLEFMDPARANIVAELGAGTGAITTPLLTHLRPNARLLAVEIYAPFADYLREHFPDPRVDVIQESAESLPSSLAARGIAGVDYIVSCLPFSTMEPAIREPIIAAAQRALLPGGAFIAYQYSPFHLEPLLRKYFVEMTRKLVLRNIPPAFIYRAVRSGDAAPARRDSHAR